MRLEGYRCDECGVESAEKPGDWHQVQAVRVTHGFHPHGWNASMSDGLHFCSVACLVANTEKWTVK